MNILATCVGIIAVVLAIGCVGVAWIFMTGFMKNKLVHAKSTAIINEVKVQMPLVIDMLREYSKDIAEIFKSTGL